MFCCKEVDTNGAANEAFKTEQNKHLADLTFRNKAAVFFWYFLINPAVER